MMVLHYNLIKDLSEITYHVSCHLFFNKEPFIQDLFVSGCIVDVKGKSRKPSSEFAAALFVRFLPYVCFHNKKCPVYYTVFDIENRNNSLHV